ncbi:fumarylacetoacetate hydrolase family protein [Bradyrhizobium erythrophlei]|uniref:2-keto-4-pentenoate hydratase/2-oxohepta-3-ene-1,7-dioic acid hydratase (Catechol pathway) n=1 Tax=Bradyrhizobium erythrophlei TaxID=1437360 RepID=A0A1H5JJV1_9BRAD|nr:fumarylacetoacetate hydrolase family protein [Bradyrhizobium erythrophlei]SEE52750.1 2-keto-4-pentenoate hydratase/2-oxohepta-3-ene-1,7-dioic acid hydratase (catechol pathway) [Bradyrhizobium erythrophlei]
MRLVTYTLGSSGARLGVVVNGLVVDVERLGASRGLVWPGDMLSLIDNGVTLLPALRECLDSANGALPVGAAVPLEDVKLQAPIPRPRKNIFGIGLNYRAHVAESAKNLDTDKDLPKRPVVFSKPPTAVIGPGAAIQHNASITRQLDWEVELAVIIGKTATRIPVEKAMDHVFGYSVMIDISARDNRRAGQWIFSKGMDTYAPFGPCIVTADEIPDPRDLRLWLTKNGVIKQDSNTKYMIFDIPALIADISSGMTLEPGDIIATGTPEGVGAGMSPQEWLWPGDVVEAGIDGVGVIRHPVVAI